ncbi:hypothetical protein ABZW03_25260 [Kitasatospora sp. NPDC004799]|uniref:hypothetical protein n=1 Tax=Kitasatospora sp. NPDC004799 TaxID=3154460 RepID=UPI00339E3F83
MPRRPVFSGSGSGESGKSAGSTFRSLGCGGGRLLAVTAGAGGASEVGRADFRCRVRGPGSSSAARDLAGGGFVPRSSGVRSAGLRAPGPGPDRACRLRPRCFTVFPGCGDGLRGRGFPRIRVRVESAYSLTVRTGFSGPGQPVRIGGYRFSGRNGVRETVVHEELYHGWFERPQACVRQHRPRPSGARNAVRLARADTFYGIVHRYRNIRGWNGSGKRK